MTVNVQDAAALKWLVEAGADEAVGEVPQNAFAPPAAKARPEKTPPTVAPPTVAIDQPSARPAPATESQAPAPQTPPTPQTPSTVPLDLEAPSAAQANARALADAATNLAELAAAMADFDGCALKFTASNLVFGDGNPDADIMFVGEAPGADEDREGRPFVGVTGQLLDRMMAAIGLDRTSAYITNILPWRPPGNRKPSQAEVMSCLPFIDRHIAIVAPKLLVFVGETSAKTLLDTTQGITRIRGRWASYKVNGADIPAIPILHPDYLLLQPALKRETWRDLQSIRQRLDD